MALAEIKTPFKVVNYLQRMKFTNDVFECPFFGIKGTIQLGTAFSPLSPPHFSPEAIIILDDLGIGLTTVDDIKKSIKYSGIISNQDKVLYSGKYLTGHPEINEPQEHTLCFIENSNLLITSFNNYHFNSLAKIEFNSISDITFEDKSTIESRVTATRLLMLGIFAFAAKKKDKHDFAYISIKFKSGKFDDEVIFEFSGANSISLANTFKNKIRKHL